MCLVLSVRLSGAGADFVMLGGMLAGHSESGGEVVEKNGKKYKLFYGMSSDTAMKKHAGGVAEYRSESQLFWHIKEISFGIFLMCFWVFCLSPLRIIPVCVFCLQSVRGEDSRSSLQRSGGCDNTRHPGRGPLHLHLCWGRQTEGAEPQDHLHQGHPTAQHCLWQRQLNAQLDPASDWRLNQQHCLSDSNMLFVHWPCVNTSEQTRILILKYDPFTILTFFDINLGFFDFKFQCNFSILSHNVTASFGVSVFSDSKMLFACLLSRYSNARSLVVLFMQIWGYVCL